MSHRYHPDPEQGDDPQAILWDDCPRCEYHAEQLVDLDPINSARIIRRTIEVEKHDGTYRSLNEAAAARRIMHAAHLIAKAHDTDWVRILERRTDDIPVP